MDPNPDPDWKPAYGPRPEDERLAWHVTIDRTGADISARLLCNDNVCNKWEPNSTYQLVDQYFLNVNRLYNQVDTRSKILDVAQRLVERRGYNGMSYQDISSEVGIRKSSIHHHFPTKDGLAEALVERYNENFRTLLSAVVESNKSARGKLRNYLALFESIILEEDHCRSCLCGMLGAEITSMSGPTSARITEFYEINAAFLEKILAQGKRDGELDISGSISITAKMIISFVEGGLFIARSEGEPKLFIRMTHQLETLLKTV